VTDPTSAVPLRDVLRASSQLAPERAALLLGGAARALAARGAPYGALTPDRVFVGPGDTVSLAPAPGGDGGPAPWPAYLAPEQIDGRPADARTDVYALGLLGWEMLAGRMPWDGDSLYNIVVKQREQDLPRLSTLRPGLPRALVQAIEGALHKAPDDRWQDPVELLHVLGPLAGRVPVPGVVVPSAGVVAPPVTPAPVAAPASFPAGPSSAAPLAPPPPRPARVPDAAPDERAAPSARPPGGPERPRRRWLTVTALAFATLAAAAGAWAVVRGRGDSGETRAWLDSVTATGSGSGAPAMPVTTTPENTTSAPIRRTGGERSRADRDRPDAEPAEPPDVSEAEADTVVTPPDLPAPPSTPAPRRGSRPARPTVPPDTATLPDTLASSDHPPR
jgi:serine/threonine-protein kinase